MQKQYNVTIDLLRIIAILGVVFIHTTTKTLEASSYDLQRTPWTLFLNQIFRFAVPLFFMISGFVLELNYHLHESYSAYLKKRFSRIFVPYVFWSGVYYFFVYKEHTMNFFQSLLSGNASYQLYFIPTLLIFYIVFPLLHKGYRFFSNRWIMIFLGLIEVVVLSYDYFFNPLPFFYPINIALLNFYIFLLGIIAAHHKEKIVYVIQKWKYLWYLITIFLGIYVFEEGKNLYLKTHNYLSFYSQWRPSVLFYTLSLTGSLYYLFNKRKLPTTWIKKLASLSFFVFFVHVIFLELLWHNIGIQLFQQTHMHIAEQPWYDPLFFLVVASLSFFCAYIVHKIPKLKMITG